MPRDKDMMEKLNFSVVDTIETDDAGLAAFLEGDPDEIERNAPPATPDPAKKSTDKKEVEEPSEKFEEDESLYNYLNEDEEEESPAAPSNSEEEDEEEEDEQEEGSEAEIFRAFTEELISDGIFTLDEGEELSISSTEELKQRLFYEKQKGAAEIVEKFVSKYGEEYEDLFDKVFVKGMSPKEYMSSFVKMGDIEGMDLDDEDNQEFLVRESLKAEGRSPEYIERRINKLKDYGELEEEATEAKKFLLAKEKEKIEAAALAVQEEQRKRQAEREFYINEVEKLLSEKVKEKNFDGLPIDRKTAQELGDYLTKEKYKLGSELLTEFDKDLLELKKPANIEFKAKVALLVRKLKEDPSLRKLINKQISNSKDSFFETVVKHKSKKKSAPVETKRFWG